MPPCPASPCLAQATYALAARARFVTSRAQAILVSTSSCGAAVSGGGEAAQLAEAAAPYLSSRAQTATRSTSTLPWIAKVLWGGSCYSRWQFLSCLSSCKRLCFPVERLLLSPSSLCASHHAEPGSAEPAAGGGLEGKGGAGLNWRGWKVRRR